jgi:hypothetical protein
VGSVLTNLVVMDIKELESGIDPNSHWYFRAKRNFLLRNVPKGCTQSVDIGAGSKFFSHELAKVNSMESVFPIDPNFSVDSTETINRCKVISLKTASDQIRNSQFWVFMDVIEHVEDDVAFLTQYVEIAPKGSTFFITVPAYQFMWSQHDVFLGHYRRYTHKSLNALVSNAGLTTTKSGYFYSLLFPLALIQRKIVSRLAKSDKEESGLTRQSFVLNKAFETLLNLELRITNGFGKLPGLTVACLAAKNV